ncbi:MAG: hypothetical protein IJD52_04525 [Alphaproteobacteria bacterium]|nr:hypothetical protein [Alphaproteobacteria bacterium]
MPRIKHDNSVSLNEAKNNVKKFADSAKISKAVGIAGCAMGGIAMMVAIVNACKANYDWTILSSVAGGFSVFLGIANIRCARDTEKHLKELRAQLERLQNQWRYIPDDDYIRG